MKKIINIRTLTIVVMVMIGVFVFLNQKKTIENNNKDPGVADNTIQRPYPKIKMENPKEVIWKIDETIQLPEKELIFRVKKSDWNGIFLRLRDTVGLDESYKTLDDPIMKVYKNESTNQELYITKEYGSMGYVEEIKNKYQLEGRDDLSDEQIKTKFEEMLRNINNNEELKIKIIKTGYKKMVFPRWVTANRGEADVIEIEASYTLEKNEMITYQGSPIRALFTKSGKLVKLEYTALAIVEEKEEIKIKDLDELKKTALSSIMILDKEGDESFDLSDTRELQKPVTVTSVEIIYIQNEEHTKIWPYYLLEGNTISSNGPLKVSMIVAADK